MHPKKINNLAALVVLTVGKGVSAEIAASVAISQQHVLLARR